MAILGQLLASTNASDMVAVESRHAEKQRQRVHTTFSHAGKGVCIKTFRFLHTVGEKRLKNLLKSFKENGLTPRVHGNTHRRPKHTLLSVNRVCREVSAELRRAACSSPPRTHPRIQSL